LNFNDWVGLLGAMLLVVALTSALIRPLPISASMLYLAAGVTIGPLGLDLLDLNVIASSNWLERASAIVVIVSLFVGGLKLRLSPRDRAWIAAYRLAGPVMVLSIAGVALAARVLFAMDWPAAILLGAILAPTDPVLAGEVSVRDARDHDRLRYGLSGEAGLNDGTAFPFVALGLGLVASSGATSWVAWPVRWPSPFARGPARAPEAQPATSSPWP
jgi:NhaP-type Na+/H+ or K+/H+ antiporter